MKIISHRDISRLACGPRLFFFFFIQSPHSRTKGPLFFCGETKKKAHFYTRLCFVSSFFLLFHHAGISDTLNGSLPILELISTQCFPRQLSATMASVIQLHNKKAKAYTKLTLPLSYFTT